MGMSSSLNLPQNMLSEEQKKRANAILLEYFHNNRYPKKTEKLKLAERAGVTLQFVINFFYNTRSRIKSLEKQQYFCTNTQRIEPFPSDFDQQIRICNQNHIRFANKELDKRIGFMNGSNNSLYISMPLIKPILLYEHDFEANDELRYTKIHVFDDASLENMNNASSIY